MKSKTLSNGFALAAILVAACAGSDPESIFEPTASVANRDEALRFLGLPGTAELPVASTFTGTISSLQGTSQDGSSVPARYFLRQDNGEVLELGKLATAAQPATWLEQRVTVSGFRADHKVATTDVQPLAQLAAAAPAALTGARPFATLLCRFSDSTGVTPEAVPFFETLMSNSFPGMDHYWRQLSYNNINLSGSRVFGWYNLPHERTFYVKAQPDGTKSLEANQLANDCFSVANADVDYRQFTGVNLMFNQDLDGPAWGGASPMNFDGLGGAAISTTWMPTWAYHSQRTLGQEMGHTFALKHSSGPYIDTYDSGWDVMSGGPCGVRDPIYGCVGVHTIAFHKDKLGWIPDARKTVVGVGTTTFTLSRLANPTTEGLLMIKIPLSADGNEFYTLEARRPQGYDSNIPHEGVLIHEVDLTRPDRTAQVVDTDNNSNANDLGAIWEVGETFIDSAHGVTVQVQSASASGFSVRVTLAGQLLTVSKVLSTGASGSVTSVPAGINCGSDCSESYNVGQLISLKAIPGPFSVLTSWEGCDVSSATTCLVTMNNARSVRAYFGRIDPTCYQDCLADCREGGTPAGQCVGVCRDQCSN